MTEELGGGGSGFESNRAGNWNKSTYGANAGRTAQVCVIFLWKKRLTFLQTWLTEQLLSASTLMG